MLVYGLSAGWPGACGPNCWPATIHLAGPPSASVAAASAMRGAADAPRRAARRLRASGAARGAATAPVAERTEAAVASASVSGTSMAAATTTHAASGATARSCSPRLLARWRARSDGLTPLFSSHADTRSAQPLQKTPLWGYVSGLFSSLLSTRTHVEDCPNPSIRLPQPPPSTGACASSAPKAAHRNVAMRAPAAPNGRSAPRENADGRAPVPRGRRQPFARACVLWRLRVAAGAAGPGVARARGALGQYGGESGTARPRLWLQPACLSAPARPHWSTQLAAARARAWRGKTLTLRS